MRKMSLLSLALFTLITSIALIGCTKKKIGDDTFVINVSTEPPTLDWTKSEDTTSSLCINNLMDGLVAFDWESNGVGVKPALAQSWTISPDAKVFTFKLRKDVKWTDGKPLTAQQFVDSWMRLVDPKTASPYAYFIFDVKNAKAINSGKLSTAELGVKALDDSTFQVTLEKPASYFLFIGTHPPTFPIRKDIIDKFGDHWTDPNNITTLGPFKLKEWVHEKKIVFERNEDYWGEKPKIKTMVGQMINEASTALSLFETGALDFTQEIPALDLERIKNDPKLSSSLRQGPFFANYYYGFNTRKPPFDNVNVRKAFSAAINREELIKVIRRDYYPLTSWIPTGMLGHQENFGIKFNPEQAKQYLRDAGYVEKNGKWVKATDGTPLPKIEIGFNTNELHSIIAENLQNQWRKNLGLEPEIRNEEWKVYLKTLKNDTPQLFRLGWVADYPDPDNFMALWYSYSEQNNTGWKNPEYDKLVQKAAGELDKDVRKALYDKAQRILVEEDVPFIPIYTNKQYFLLKPYVSGYTINPMQQWRFSDVTVERENKKN